MAMRNFWTEMYVDGRDTPIAGGPRSKDGGMEIVVRQRDNGQLVVAATIICSPDYSTGEIVTCIKDSDDNVIKEIRTKR